jgi:anaphase-promoting complex subunit 10
LLTIHFLRRVEIRAIRFYVDYHQDESYTPTHIVFYAGTGHHDLIQFAEVPMTEPSGWQEVPIADCGGGADGHSLCCWIVQVHVKENHQNGKDTHIRGIKIYALDDPSYGAPLVDSEEEVGFQMQAASSSSRSVGARSMGRNMGTNMGSQVDPELQSLMDLIDSGYSRHGHGDAFSDIPSFMRDPEIR